MPRILVIDDNTQFREVVSEFLTRAGYDVLAAANGKMGLELFYDKKPDLVITDVIMPEKDGPEVIFELQKKVPGIKIIAFSGGGGISGKEYLQSITNYANLKYTFEKPFAMKDLLKAVKDLIG
jgi:DNA-binding response OmpR family regulator